MKIAVAGGAGLTGQCAVRDLLRSRKVEQILVADYDARAIQRLKKKLGDLDPRLSFAKVDVTKHDQAASKFKGYEVVINGVQYYYNLDVMSSALKARCSYLDFGGLFHTTLKQIKMFGDNFRKQNLLGVVGMGAQPGITNLMVKEALRGYDRAVSVEIFDGWRDMTRTQSPMYFTWSPLTFFDESSQNAIVFRNGKYETRSAFSEPESIYFPPPVGKIDVYVALHSEIATLPVSFKSYGLKKVIWKEGGADFWKIKLLADLGLTSNEKIQLDGARISPRKFLLSLLESKGMTRVPENALPNDYEITRVIIRGLSRRGERKKVVGLDAYFPAYKKWRVSCSQYNVGVPGSIAAQMIAKDSEILPKGVHPAEQVFEPIPFFKELERRGIKIKKWSSSN